MGSCTVHGLALSPSEGSVSSSVIRFAPLIALLIWAAVEDTRARRVPNWISFGLILAGLLLTAAPWGHLRFAQALAGCGVGFVIGMILHLLRAIGAGDVKLLAAVGVWVGAKPVLVVFAGAAVLGMLMAMWFGARQGRIRGMFRDGMLLGVSLAQGSTANVAGFETSAVGTTSASRQRGLPFAVAIALSTIVLLAANAMSGR